METLVTTEWLSQHLDDPDLVVLDCTVAFRPGGPSGFQIMNAREEYDTGHIPGAGFADLLNDLSDRDSPYYMTLPTPEQFCAAMGALGVGNDSRVVVYDVLMNMMAARVWWMLRWVGFDRAAVLDGGLNLWQAEGRPLSKAPATRPARTLAPRLRPEVIATRDDVLAALGDPAVRIVDTLDPNSYRLRHIPGASNCSAFDLTGTTGRYKPLEALETQIPGDRRARTITYCGGGVAAASGAFSMLRLGYSDVAVYIGSLQEWVLDPANPLDGEAPEEVRRNYGFPKPKTGTAQAP
jgi:thiosulfate/3-mercaptopyruvate sulfurtransferase